MLTGELRPEIDGAWKAFWVGGMANPLEIIEQIAYRLLVVVTSVNASTDASIDTTCMTIIGLLDLHAVHVFRLGDAWFRRWTRTRVSCIERRDQGESFRGCHRCYCTHSDT
jgi:hypothetical protein